MKGYNMLFTKTPIELQKELEKFFHLPYNVKSTNYPLINMVGKKDEVMITAEIPGIDPDKIDISVQDNFLTISGERVQQMPEQLRIRERNMGSFTRTVKLPFRIDTETVEAKYQQGVLCIFAKQIEQDKPRKIEIKSL